jgi:signal transduction histidine kinase
MASATASSTTRNLVPLESLRARLGQTLVRGGTVPILVLRLSDVEREAWRKGVRAARRLEHGVSVAFHNAARQIVRAGDVLAHDRGSASFIIGLVDVAREKRLPNAVDCRVTLERIALRMTTETSHRMESGWWAVERCDRAEEMERAIALALERGARERERYEFLAALGHELRTPLASIRGYLESVLEQGNEFARTSRVRRYLETAQRETLRLGRMVDGMLEFSLLDLSPPLLASRFCDACERIIVACEIVEPLALRRGITLCRELPAAMPVRIDADACMHALLNLLDNAVTHGREQGTVCVSCRTGDTLVDIIVEDDGPGLRASSARGHGIGLMIARTIAERAGGTVRLERSLLGGVRATLSLLPANDVHGAENATTAS